MEPDNDEINDLINSDLGRELISNFEDIEQASLLHWEKRELVKANLKQFREKNNA